jgi:hypothetical protein
MSARTTPYAVDSKALAILQNRLQNLPDNWVQCRDMKHAWTVDDNFHVTRFGLRNKIAEIKRILVCLRCGTKRHETYVPTGWGGLEKVRSYYQYPEEYQIRGVPRGVKPQQIIQQEQWRRVQTALAEQAAAHADTA